jgi:hypothetical protein
MGHYEPNLYFLLFRNNPIYRDPTKILGSDEFYFLVLWENGFSDTMVSELFEMKISRVKQIERNFFEAMEIKCTKHEDLSNRAYVHKAYVRGILTNENSDLPKEVVEWLALREKKRQKAIA